jgi:hypothetical protein
VGALVEGQLFQLGDLLLERGDLVFSHLLGSLFRFKVGPETIPSESSEKPEDPASNFVAVSAAIVFELHFLDASAQGVLCDVSGECSFLFHVGGQVSGVEFRDEVSCRGSGRDMESHVLPVRPTIRLRSLQSCQGVCEGMLTLINQSLQITLCGLYYRLLW